MHARHACFSLGQREGMYIHACIINRRLLVHSLVHVCACVCTHPYLCYLPCTCRKTNTRMNTRIYACKQCWEGGQGAGKGLRRSVQYHKLCPRSGIFGWHDHDFSWVVHTFVCGMCAYVYEFTVCVRCVCVCVLCVWRLYLVALCFLSFYVGDK